MGSSKTITITGLANLKSVTLYGNGHSSSRTITVTVTKVSGSGSAFTVTDLSLPEGSATISSFQTDDFSAKSGYDASTYYTYTFTASGDVSIWGIYLEAGPTCTAPNHVDISGAWDRFGGETISLTATAYSSAGTGSPIADANITGWQWQKWNGSSWVNVTNGTVDGVVTSGATSKNLQISNCGGGNSGTYRCTVSTGATCSTSSDGYGVKVYVLECYTGGTTTYNFTRDGNNQAGSLTIDLAANTAYQFKFHADNDYYGNNTAINEDVTNWVCSTSQDNNITINSGLGGTFTIDMEYSTAGNSSVVGEPEISVTYPRKRIYLSPGVWNADDAKFAYNYYRDGGSGGWTDFLTEDDCGMYADVPQWNGVILIPARLKNTTVSPGSWDDRWNQTDNITVNSNNYVTITGWDASDFTYTIYSAPTYTISYAKGSPSASISGSKSDETKTCGVDFTLPSSAVFTREGYLQTGWTTSDGGSQTHALGGTYTTNAARTFYPVWTVNRYSVTHTLSHVTKSSGATGADAATYGTDYTATFAASSGYALPNSVTVTAGGSDITASCTWTKATGTVSIPGASITGNIVITVTGVNLTNFQMVADASAASDETLANNESISQGSKNCTMLTGGTAVYSNADGDTKSMSVKKASGGSQYGWQFNVAKDVITITLTSHVLQVGSVITFSGYVGTANYGISVNTSTTLTKSGSSGEFTKSYTVTAGDTHLVGKNVLVLKREGGSARMYSFTISNCQSATPCTTPTLPSLSNQAGCSYSEWNATPSNASTITSVGETISYSWKKGATEKATTASYTPDANGTDYTVTVTVSKAGKIPTSVTSSALTATKYGNPTVTGPSDADYEIGDVATNLSVTATPDHGESLTYQWYSNTAKSTSSPTPTVLENCTTSTYKPSTAAAATTYYFCKVSGGCADVYSSIATVTVTEESCFKFKVGTTKAGSGWDVPNNGAITTELWTDGTQVLTGGTLTNTSGSTLGGNNSYGLVYAASGNKQLTLALTGGNSFGVGTVISITGYSNNSTDACGFTINGNDMSPATYTPASADYTKFTQSYTVSASDGVDGETSITIDAATNIRVYLNAITVTGCVDCTPITPSLSYSKTTIWMDDAVKTATPILDKDESTGSVTYALTSVTSLGCVTLNTSTGVVTAVKSGTATITASIAADGTHCANTASCNITVKEASCGYNEIASAVLTSKTAATLNNATLLANGLGDISSGSCKLNGKGAYFGLQLASGSFQVGDSIEFKIKGGDDAEAYFFATTDTTGLTTSDAIYCKSSISKGTDYVVRFIVTSGSMLTKLNATKKITIVRRTKSGVLQQNHSVYYVKVKRYTCPEGLMEFDATANSNWSTAGNWVGATGRGAGLPTINDRVHVMKPVTVDVTTAKAERVYLFQNSTNTGSLVLDAGKELVVAGTVCKTTDGSSYTATGENDIVFNSTSGAGLGALVMGSHDGTNKATVNFTTRSKGIKDDNTSIAQYVGTPFNDETNILHNWYNSWVYGITCDGSNNIDWERVNEGQGMTPFRGYCVFSADGADHVYWEQGTLNATTDRTISGLNWQSGAGTANLNNENLLANSWMAPIYIKAMQSSDFVNADATIYIFNSTSASEYESGGGFAGNYDSYTVNTAEAVIPAMQSFSVFTTGTGASVTLDYSRIVYDPAVAGTATPAPNKIQRRERKNDNEANKLRIFVRTESGLGDMLYMWEREDFSEAFENGWDGRKMYGESYAPQLYAITPDGAMAVNCVPTYEGVLIGFRAGTDEQTYTFSFEYDADAEPLYLYDKYADAYTRVLSGNTYQFVANDYDAHARFSLTHYMPGVATGMDAVSGQQSAVRCQKILLNERILILRDGKLYDVTGKTVK